MKWVFLAIALGGVIPLAQLLRQRPKYKLIAWMLFGFLPFAYNPDIALIDWAGWPGYVKGILVTGFDVLAFALFVNSPKPKGSDPFRVVMIFYFIAVFLTIFYAQVPMAAGFYAWQLLKVYFIYLVVRRACADERVVEAILTGMIIALCYETILAGWQRAGQGVLRAHGTLGDKNLLGLASEFGMFAPFALLLAGQRSWLAVAAPVAGVLVAILTASRAALGFGLAGLVMIYTISALRAWTPTKAKVLMFGVLFAALVSPFAIQSLQERFDSNPYEYQSDERAIFNRAAAEILSDHPFGAGANNYVVVANGGGYSDRAGVPWSSAVAIVHSIYWLTAAETGYLGVFALILLLLKATTFSLRCGWAHRSDPRGDLLLGLGITIFVVALHSQYEWVFLVCNIQYLFAIVLGMVAGLSQQMKYEEKRTRNIPVPISASIVSAELRL